MNEESTYYIYIMSNKKDGMIYIGFSGNLKLRLIQHKNRYSKGYVNRHHLTMLVYYEKFGKPNEAIKREKQIKKWNRQWKINLINDFNPNWDDLSYFFNI